MENQTQQNQNDEKVLTLKGLEKEVNLKFKEYDKKIEKLERRIEVLTRAMGGMYAK